jgi:hypothetical protein
MAKVIDVHPRLIGHRVTDSTAPQLFDKFAAIMLLGLDAILCGQAADNAAE